MLPGLCDLLTTWQAPAPVGNDPLAPTIFHEDWWLDIVTDHQCRFVETMQDGIAVGRMPYFAAKKLIFTASLMPVFTHFLGPAIIPANGNYTTRLIKRNAIVQDLARQLPKMSGFWQKMHAGVTDVIAFQMAGFETGVQFTFVLKPQAPDVLWRGLRDKTRNVARKASKSYSVDDSMGVEAFLRLYNTNLAALGRGDPINEGIVFKLISTCLAKGRGRILSARDGDGAVKAAIFCVWDHSVCYYLRSTRTADSGNGAITLLLWAAIQQAAAGGLTFDFDGLGYEGAVHFYSGFGAEIQPRYIISRSSIPFRAFRSIKRRATGSVNKFT